MPSASIRVHGLSTEPPGVLIAAEGSIFDGFCVFPEFPFQ